MAYTVRMVTKTAGVMTVAVGLIACEGNTLSTDRSDAGRDAGAPEFDASVADGSTPEFDASPSPPDMFHAPTLILDQAREPVSG